MSNSLDRTASQVVPDSTHRIALLRQGEHLCSVYETTEEMLSQVIPYVKTGLLNGEQCLYVAEENSRERMTSAFIDAGVDVCKEIERGRLVFWTRREYRQPGTFNLDVMSTFIRGALKEALTQGHAGIRLAVETTWTVNTGITAEQLVRWEDLINEISFPGSTVSFLCQYNACLLPANLIRKAVCVHPTVVLGEQICPNPYRQSADRVLGNYQAGSLEWLLAALKRQPLSSNVARNGSEMLSEGLRERPSLEQLSGILDGVLMHLPVGLYICEAPSGVIMDYNSCAVQLWGRKPACDDPEERFWPLLNVYRHDGSRLPRDQYPMAQAIQKGATIHDLELVLERPDRSRRTVLVKGMPLRSEHGEIIAGLVILQDITERKQHEQALQKMNETLEVQVKDRTAALLAKQQQLQSLAAELSLTEERERKRLAMELHDNLAQMLALCNLKLGAVRKDLKTDRSSKSFSEVKNLLDEALKYTRTLMSDLHPMLLGDEDDLPAAISWVAERMRRHGVVVTLQDDGEPKVLDEEVLITTYQSIHELLFNVLKHAKTKEATVSLARAGEHLEAVVTDQGAGFDVSAGRNPSKEGTFGLFNIRERLDLLGGRLEVVSAIDEGTCAKVIVPLKAGTCPTPSPYRQREAQSIRTVDGLGLPAEPAASKIQVLLADDHQIMREGLLRIIEDQTDMLVVAEATDGEMAVEITRDLQPDVVVMDVNMPKMNGVEATRQITSEFPQITVVGLSVNEDSKTAFAMREAGASAYLSKGKSFEMLCATIRATRVKKSKP